jgi:hypothetical protein
VTAWHRWCSDQAQPCLCLMEVASDCMVPVVQWSSSTLSLLGGGSQWLHGAGGAVIKLNLVQFPATLHYSKSLNSVCRANNVQAGKHSPLDSIFDSSLSIQTLPWQWTFPTQFLILNIFLEDLLTPFQQWRYSQLRDGALWTTWCNVADERKLQ